MINIRGIKRFDLQILVRFRSPEQGRYNAVEISMIVPIVFVQQKDVPVRQYKASACDLKVQTERDSEGTYPHHRVYHYHPWKRRRFHTVDQWEMTVPWIAPFYVNVCQSSLLDNIYYHA